jgi:hypothetical protein
MARHQVLQPHGTVKRYRQGCKCDPCRAANAEYQRCFKLGLKPVGNVSPIRGRKPSAQAAAQRAQEKSGPSPRVRSGSVGEVERAVRGQLKDFAADNPTQVEMAIVAAKILDNPERVALHPTTIRQLGQIVEGLTAGKKKKSRGRLAAVQSMTDRGARKANA